MYETLAANGLHIILSQDEWAENPYTDGCNLGTIYHHHRGFTGEKMDAEDIQALARKIMREGGIVLPVYLHEHGGQTIRTTGFSCPWDSGQVGIIAVTADEIRNEYECKRITAATRKDAEGRLVGEIKTLDQWMRGDVWRWRIENAEGEVLDACGGFYGYDYALSEAQAMARYLLKDVYAEQARALEASRPDMYTQGA